MNNILIRVAAVIAVSVVFSLDAAEPTMTKIVTRAVGPEFKPGSFAAKPKTLYRAGTKYARTEEEVDTENNIHGLIIVNEPDSWMVNLADKSARHFVDPGPTFDFHAPILWLPKSQNGPEVEPWLKNLELGNELQFFKQHAAQFAGTRQADGHNCKALVLKRGKTIVTLLIDLQTEKPVQLNMELGGASKSSIRYLEYKTGLPFRASLFAKPKGVNITEGK